MTSLVNAAQLAMMSRQDATTGLEKAAPHLTPAHRGRRLNYPTGRAVPISLSYPMIDYVIDPTVVRSQPQVGRLTQLGHGAHYRIVTRESFATGEVEHCVLADGFHVQICDLSFREPTVLSVTAPNMLRVRVASESKGRYASSDGDSVSFDAPSAAIIIEPAGRSPADAFYVGPNRAAHVTIHRDTLSQLYAGGGRELPGVLQAFLDGDLERTVARSLSLAPAMLRCVEDLQGCTLEGDSRRLFIRAKAMEILCHAFEALGHDERAVAPTVSARGVMKAQRILEDNFISPPTLDQLAHEVGISRSGLCAGFRQILGQSVYDYIQDLRMQHALTLLAGRDTPITQIGYALGYNHPSSFSAAVLRRFGATPRELRRRGTVSDETSRRGPAPNS